MNKLVVLLLLSSLLFCDFQCNDCEDELHDRSSYLAKISPLRIHYNIDDTISIGSSFSSIVKLDLSDENFNNSNQTITFVVQIFELEPNDEPIIRGIENFEIISGIGHIAESPYYEKKFAKEVINTCDNNNCEFLINIIPQKKGIFCINLLNSRLGDDECKHLSLMNNNFGLDNNNYEICQEINTSRNTIQVGKFFYPNPADNDRFYFFEVD